MPACPVCDVFIDADDAAFEHHVNAHFEDPSGSAQNAPHNGATNEPAQASCFVCGTDLSGLTELAANAHVSDCLDGGAGGAPEPEFGPDDDYDELHNSDEDDTVQQNARKDRHADGAWDGSAFASRGLGGDKEAAKGDRWWDPVRGSLTAGAVPPNYSPGIIPVLKSLLLRSASAGSTRSAVLARNGLHIKGSFGFDGSWGCGYRNGLMAIATTWTDYRSVYKSDPGVRSIQQWIEDAWRAGYDPDGKEQLKGKVVGTRKWIGTTDLYAMFSSLGVPCTLYDFPKPADRASIEPTHKILERWTRQYFDGDDNNNVELTDAFTQLMRSPVRVGTKLPFILQHAGHSRTVVGYELAGKDFNLLIFDPAKNVPKDVREAAIAAQRQERDSNIGPISAASSDPSPTLNVREGAAAAEPSDEDEVGPGGWIRRKRAEKSKDKSDPLLSSLGVFRVNLGKWKAHTQFQVLVFDGGAILGAEARRARREVTSTVVGA